MSFQITIDSRDFNRSLKKYMDYTKNSLAETINTKAYYIARNAVNETLKAQKPKITSELRAPSRVNPFVPLVCILVQKKLNSKGKKGVNGKKMKAEANKFIGARQASKNYLRAGWIAAIKAIEPFVKKKSGPRYPKIVPRGVAKGGAKPAKTGKWVVSSEIFNSISGAIKFYGLNKTTQTGKIQKILEKGLTRAVALEVASMEKWMAGRMDAIAKKSGLTP